MKSSPRWQIIFTSALCFVSVLIPSAAAVADDDVAALVAQRVQDWQPVKEERLLDQVGWASDLVEARRLAEKHRRPLFLFTYNGSTSRVNAIALQRC